MKTRYGVGTGVGAVVLAAACATPFLLHGRDGSSPDRVRHTATEPAGALTGDVDGDGSPDVVTLGNGDRLRVRLGSGRTVARLLQDRPRLEGLVDVDGHGLAIVTSGASEGRSRTWTAWELGESGLTAMPVRGRQVIGTERGSTTAWVTGHRLYDGSLDPLQAGAVHLAVAARTWSLRTGHLTPTTVGLRCWDRSSDLPPATCRPGQDWAYDPGPHGDLPALLPTVQPAWADRSSTTFGTDTWLLRDVTPDVDPEAATYDVVHRSDGVTHRRQVPQGWRPLLFRAPVRVGDGSALLLSQEGGDSDTWRVYVDRGGQVQPVPTRGPVALGGGFTGASGGEAAYLSWLTPGGRLYTRVGTERPGHFHVWAWQPTGGDATTAPTLVAHDLGTVCIDELLGTYGTCH